jgi:hypothetical protein
MTILIEQTCTENCTAVFFELIKSLNSCWIAKNGLNSSILEIFRFNLSEEHVSMIMIEMSTDQKASNEDLFVFYHVPNYRNHCLFNFVFFW